ncbi:MAG: hypothetical protein R3F49_00230 [Planctomycetota bacterium]
MSKPRAAWEALLVTMAVLGLAACSDPAHAPAHDPAHAPGPGPTPDPSSPPGAAPDEVQIEVNEAPTAVVSDGPARQVTYEIDEARRGPRDPAEWAPLAMYAGHPVTIAREFDPSGTRLMRIHTVMGDPSGTVAADHPPVSHGPDWRYYEGGFAARVEHWLEGQLDGTYRSWWPNGQPREEGAYIAGAREGLWRRFSRQGKCIEEGVYVGGEKDGLHQTWFGDGQLEESAAFHLGVPHGALRRFSRSGMPLLEANYVEGVLHGKWADHYVASGALRDFGEYDRGARVGVWRTAREDGQGLLLEETYVAGKREGLQRTWSPEGPLALEKTFVADVASGMTRSWYPDGRPQSEGALLDGARVGAWTYWSPDGSVNDRWSGTYEADHRVGP